jgi:hypothetical protein
LRPSQTQGWDFDSLFSTTIPERTKRVALRATTPDSISSLIHHIRAVTTITDTIPTPCENHSQIVAAKRVPAPRGGQVLFEIRFP